MSGCGNSLMTEQMYDDGYHQITNIDISKTCIKNMSLRNQKSRPGLKWEVMDVRNLSYPDETFDVIIDKCTIDAILCSKKPHYECAIMLKEC